MQMYYRYFTKRNSNSYYLKTHVNAYSRFIKIFKILISEIKKKEREIVKKIYV